MMTDPEISQEMREALEYLPDPDDEIRSELLINGMFNLDDENDYIRKGFDMPKSNQWDRWDYELCAEALGIRTVS